MHAHRQTQEQWFQTFPHQIDFSALIDINDAGPLAEISLLLGAVWLAVILYADAIVSPADTGLIYTALAPRLSYSQAKVGNAPRALAKLNKHGVPWISLLVVFIVFCIMFLPFPSWAKLVGFITSGTVLSFASGPVVVAALRRQLPEQERPFKLPGGDVLPIIGYVVMILHHVFAKAKNRLPDLEMRSGWWMILWMVGLVVLSFVGN